MKILKLLALVLAIFVLPLKSGYASEPPFQDIVQQPFASAVNECKIPNFIVDVTSVNLY